MVLLSRRRYSKRKVGLGIIACLTVIYIYKLAAWEYGDQLVYGSCDIVKNSEAFKAYLDEIAYKRELVLEYVEHMKKSQQEDALYPPEDVEYYELSPVNHVDYFQKVLAVGRGTIKTIKYSCTSPGDNYPKSGVVDIYYKWSLDPEVCALKHESVPYDCDINSRYYKTLPGRSIETETIPRNFTFFHNSTKDVQFYVHIIPFGIVDINGNVADNHRILLKPHSCQSLKASSKLEYVHLLKGTAPEEKEIFVISQYQDSHHTEHEILSRITVYIPFLKSFPNIKIHVTRGLNGKVTGILQGLGFSESRVISGSYTAQVVYLPQGSGCTQLNQPAGQILSHTYKQHYTQNKQLQPKIPEENNLEQKTLILIQPSSSSSSSTNTKLKEIEKIQDILEAQAKENKFNFIVYNVDEYGNDVVKTRQVFSNAALVFSPTNSGLSQLMYSTPGTYVIEIMCRSAPYGYYKHLVYTQGMRYHGLVSSNENCSEMEIDLDMVVKSVEYFVTDFRKQNDGGEN